MSGWRKVRLGNVAAVRSGFAFKSKDWQSDGVPVVKIQNVRSGRVDLENCSFVSEPVASTASRYELAPGDVLITMSGEIGSVGVFKGGRRALLNQRVGRIESLAGANVDQRFLAFALQHPAVKAEFEAAAYGVAQANISPSLIAQIEVAVPSMVDQRKIVAILSALDDLVDINRRRISLLEQMAKLIYREWFVRFRYPGHEDDKVVDLPSGWTSRRLGEIATAVTDSVDPTAIDDLTPAVGLEHIPRRSLTLIEWGKAGELTSRKTCFLSGDVLFGKIRPYFHKVCVAPVDGICSTDAIVLRPANDELRGLVAMTAFSDEFVGHAVTTSNGTKMPRADWNVLREWPVPVPPAELLGSFNDTTQTALKLCSALAAQARKLETLRELLLPKLVTGTIDVSRVDLAALLDESAA